MRRIVLLALIGLLATGTIAVGLRAYDFVENDPRFCTSCHLMNPAAQKWQDSAHNDVGCHACHQQSIGDSLGQLYHFVRYRPAEITKHAVVDAARCAACHASHDDRWKQVAETAGHMVHSTRAGIQCVTCHSKGLHRFVRPSDACADCHEMTMERESAMTSFHCTTCHNFLATDHELGSPERDDCLECHEHMQVHEERFDGDAPMNFPCHRCHQPHQHMLPTMDDCTDCHDTSGSGLHAVPFHADCLSCHRPHLWHVEGRATCLRCHAADRMDHYPDLACAGCHSFAKEAAAAVADPELPPPDR
jgi:nitrate/TMAO reductase-like tetraheme cytochrome c subunit